MSESIKKICHITTVHPRYDIRIFYKECLSLTSAYKVFLIVADGKGDEEIRNINIIDVSSGKKSRIHRIIFTGYRAFRKALEVDCEIYHFHDPEFLFYGLFLQRRGKKVIYDVHEDLPKQILSKTYLNPLLRKIMSQLILVIEKYISPRLSAIVTVTKSIQNRFSELNHNCYNINNYPKFEELGYKNGSIEKRNEICYIGDITKIRGIEELIDSIECIDLVLNLAGNFESESFKNRLMNKPGWKKVNYLGFINPKEAFNVMLRSFAGISTLYPEPNYLNSQATKIYEYMYAGIPVVASNFPLWKELIDKNNCGICVDPKNKVSVAEAISYLKDNPEIAKTMGENGKQAVIEVYSWKTEEKKLLDLYSIMPGV
jgi:glycosyltransferase involved in cell wall biosynthesis